VSELHYGSASSTLKCGSLNFPDVYKETMVNVMTRIRLEVAPLVTTALWYRQTHLPSHFIRCLHRTCNYRYCGNRNWRFCTSDTSVPEFHPPLVFTTWSRWHTDAMSMSICSCERTFYADRQIYTATYDQGPHWIASYGWQAYKPFISCSGVFHVLAIFLAVGDVTDCMITQYRQNADFT
jgi:hypothetical protein